MVLRTAENTLPNKNKNSSNTRPERRHTHTHTHTGNREVTVQVTLACYSRPGQVASCSHSSVGIHPLGGIKTKLRFLALPGSSIWPRLPLGAGLPKDIGYTHRTATQRNATQRNATHRNSTPRHATPRPASPPPAPPQRTLPY